jgi:E3 ubiquitin-protein ligase RNF115/126
MEEAQETRYWCHNCEEVVVPVEPEKKCPDCDGGFVEEMGSEDFEPSMNVRSEQNLSLWAPLLLGMMGGSSRRSRPRRDMMDSSSDEEEGRQARIRRALRDTDDEDEEEDDDDSDRELQDLIRRRRRRGSSLVRLLQTLRDDLRGLDDIGRDRDRGLEGLRERRERERARRDRERERERARERDRGRERTESVILINSNNEAIILQGTFGPNGNQEHSSNTNTGVSLGDYFLGPGLDLLLQRLADSDLNRSGTPPAKKESVAALPTVNIQEVLGCTVCLEEFEMGTEAKEMPCQHKFHTSCILPWLELHSSCPVCRFQLPTEESKNPCESGSGGGTVSADGDDAESSSSDVEGTDHNGGSQPGSPIFPENVSDSDIRSALDALFPNQSSSSES